MSFLHPNAPTNSNGEIRDPFDLDAWQDLHPKVIPRDTNVQITHLWQDFFQWRRISEDVVHFTPFDDLPADDRNRIRARRLRAFKDSRIPWQITDLTSLLTAIDDVDDMGKSIKFLREYAVKPAIKLTKPPSTLELIKAEDELDDFKRACALAASGHARKRALLRANNWNWLAFLGEGLLGILFPSWRFIALGLQFLQTTDSLFGVGVQLGPLLGLLSETAFRGLEGLGLPFGPDHNKYNQILAARTTQRMGKLLAAHRQLHPEDRLTLLGAGLAASHPTILPPIVIPPEDYPDVGKAIRTPAEEAWRIATGDSSCFSCVLTEPWQQLKNFAGLAASIPYNSVATVLNNFLGPTLANWSESVNGVPSDAQPTTTPDNLQRELLRLAELGICPGKQCNAEIYQDLQALATAGRRFNATDHGRTTIYQIAQALGLSLPAEILTALLGGAA